jgi:hypothetical protein
VATVAAKIALMSTMAAVLSRSINNSHNGFEAPIEYSMLIASDLE